MSEQTQSVQTRPTGKISDALFAKLRTVPILSSLNDDELHCLEGSEEIHLQKNDLLVRQGEVAHYFWILLEGQLRVFQTLADGKEAMLAPLIMGMLLGRFHCYRIPPILLAFALQNHRTCFSSTRKHSGN